MIRSRPAVVVVCLAGIIAGSVTHAADTARAPRRIITLAPHLTELVFEVGAGDRLVGVVEYSDFPHAAREIPRIGDALRLDLERIIQLEPDLVLAWESGNPVQLVQQLTDLELRVVTLKTARPADVADQLEFLGQLLGQQDHARVRAETFRQELKTLIDNHIGYESIRTFYQISDRPLYTVNGQHMITEMVEICGGVNVFSHLEDLAPTVSPEAVIAVDPEVIISGRAAGLKPWGEYAGLAANRYGNLFTVSEDVVTRPGPRVIQGVSEICSALDYGRENRTTATD